MAQSQEQSLPFKSGYTSELAGLGLFFWAVFLVLALLSFDKGDPTLNHVRSVTEIHNKAGLFGAYVSGFLNEWFGLCAFLWPLFFVAIAGPCLSSRLTLNWRRWVGIFILTLFLMETVVAWNLQFGDFSPGGILGNGLYQSSVHFLNPLGASLFWLFIFLVALQLIINISWIDLFVKLTAYLKAKHEQIQANRTKIPSAKTSHQGVTPLKNTANFLTNCLNFFKRKSEDKIPNLYQKAKRNSQKSNPTSEKDPFLEEIESPLTKVDWEEDVDVRQDPKSKKQIKAKAQAKPTPEPEITPEPEPEEMVEAELPIPVEMPKPKPVKLKETPKASPTPTPTPKTPKVKKEGPFELPPLDILREPQHVENEEDLEEKGNILIQTLREFNIESELVDITPGPVVTLFEVRPAAGVRVSKFIALSDDIARVLKAKSVRILAPVPGCDTVGIEIPNVKREVITFRELISQPEFQDTKKNPLTIALGKDTKGNPVYADLAKMPHLLIAGCTGSGKSVGINSILASFLYRSQPEDVKLILIDPKRVELTIYADEPHLIHPVVNEPADAKNALDWATHEMDERFKKMSKLMVRDITSFNKRLATYNQNNLPPDLEGLEHLPYLVIVIDEFSDLMMMSDRSEIEKSIIRLAQLGRACGIHMILATQKPTVNVVTGLIKTNLPCRISFKVASNPDSRTILDSPGAEKLLGMGDMLYLSSNDSALHRLHGAFLSDDEVRQIVNHWKEQSAPSYKVDFSTWNNNSKSQGGQGSNTDDDELYDEVLAFVYDEGMASISKIQRRFKIGFNRAARLVETFEAQGILEHADGSKPRKVKAS